MVEDRCRQDDGEYRKADEDNGPVVVHWRPTDPSEIEQHAGTKEEDEQRWKLQELPEMQVAPAVQFENVSMVNLMPAEFPARPSKEEGHLEDFEEVSSVELEEKAGVVFLRRPIELKAFIKAGH